MQTKGVEMARKNKTVEDIKMIPLWNNPRYSIGYFKEAFLLIKLYFGLCTIKGLNFEGLRGVWDTLVYTVLGKALYYTAEFKTKSTKRRKKCK